MATDDEVEISLSPDECDDPETLRRKVARALRRPPQSLPELRVRRRSIDARRGNVRIRIVVGMHDRPRDLDLGAPHPRAVDPSRRAIIVGAGPAGLFCAYELARAGIASVVIDRGKQVQPRRRDLRRMNQFGEVPPDSNYCFGEGGAGTYSDGKLYTRSKKRGDIDDVIDILVRHGAPLAIRADARPHIGSNRLPRVITSMREELERVGVEFRFESRATGFEVRGRRVMGVVIAGKDLLEGDAVVLATGHSARDVLTMLRDASVELEPKAFALGVRIEHPQPLIDAIQYGASPRHPNLPAAYYRLATTVSDRGVFSFCMCPGGWIVPATTEAGTLVVNGMSLAKRGSPFANSGIVTAIEPTEWQAAGFSGALGGNEFQLTIERTASEAGGGALVAPATRLTDFLAGRPSSTVPETSYIPGVVASNVADVLDCARIRVSDRLRDGLREFGRRMPAFITEEAVLVAVESRTSSPVRVPRDPTTLESPDMAALYPTGEGAGYAGGIVSAAMDGMAVARRIIARFS